MRRASVASNESSGENDSLLLSSSTTVIEQIESIASNMEETSANCNTNDSTKSNNSPNANESHVSCDECDKTTTTTSTSMSTSKSTTEPLIDIESMGHNDQHYKAIPTSDTLNGNQTKKKAVKLLSAPNVETICDDISVTTEDIKRLKHVQVRSNSTGKLYQSSRRVSFPENDSELVTGYLEPADPWAYG